MGIQMLAVFLPGLRSLLGIDSLNQSARVTVAASVLFTWGIAEVYPLLGRVGRNSQA
jgi:hypothetical protein